MNEKAKEALRRLKCAISTHSDYYETGLRQIEEVLNDFDKYHENQQDLIIGKDEYIAKLCNDRAELKEHEKELIKEQNRLFDLCKEQEKALKIIAEKRVNALDIHLSLTAKGYNERMRIYSLVDYFEDLFLTEEEFNLVKKVVEKYGKEKIH